MKFQIKRLTKPKRRELETVNQLLAQLSELARLSKKQLNPKAFRQEGAYIYVLTDTDQPIAPIIGMASIYFLNTLTGLKTFVEDVVVDKNYRGRGLSKLLMNSLIKLARQKRAKYIELTSNPRRLAANALYRSLGFQLLASAIEKGSNLYRLYL